MQCSAEISRIDGVGSTGLKSELAQPSLSTGPMVPDKEMEKGKKEIMDQSLLLSPSSILQGINNSGGNGGYWNYPNVS